MRGSAAPQFSALYSTHLAATVIQADSSPPYLANLPQRPARAKGTTLKNPFSRKKKMPQPRSHDIRRGRYSEAGRSYLLTTVTHQRRSLFHDFHHARLVIQQLRRCELERSCRSLAWVVMPDHVHWLIELKALPLGEVMRRFKARSSLALHRAGVPSQRVWQAGYHDRALRREEDVLHVARYIVANPVRAGLVRSVREYSHWDAVWL